MSRQAIFMGVVGWEKVGGLDNKYDIERMYSCQEEGDLGEIMGDASSGKRAFELCRSPGRGNGCVFPLPDTEPATVKPTPIGRGHQLAHLNQLYAELSIW